MQQRGPRAIKSARRRLHQLPVEAYLSYGRMERKIYFLVENDRVCGPNVIPFELVVGEGIDGLGKVEQYYIFGCYIPPSDTDGTTLRRIEHTM